MKTKFLTSSAVILTAFYSSNVYACASGESGFENIFLFIIFTVSAILAFYSVFSRLIFRPAMVWMPIAVVIVAFYFGMVKLGCMETNHVSRSLVTLAICIGLSLYETWARRNANSVALQSIDQ